MDVSLKWNADDRPIGIEDGYRFFYASLRKDTSNSPYVGEDDISYAEDHLHYAARYAGKHFTSFGELEKI